MFDKVEITVRAGGGGDGAVSFRHEKYAEFGGPDGGDGGDGGDVIILADAGITDLRMFRGKKVYSAGRGENGKGKKQHGKKGKDLVLGVPAGCVAWRNTPSGSGEMVADLELPGQQAVVARGGRGGLGNVHFASSTNQAPQLAQKGEAGEEISLVLELRLIADAGIIGYPNVGKSTLLTAASAARPKIAGYPFTTLEPVLGLVEVNQRSFVLAEVPGLIDDAHLGRGLGHDFLRHALRTKILIHLIDGASASPVEDMLRVNAELSLFDPALAQKPQLVAVNKVDLPQVSARLAELKELFSRAGTPVFFLSAMSGEGVPELMAAAVKLLGKVAERVKSAEPVPGVVFRPQPRDAGVTVSRDGDTFVVNAPALERIVSRVDMGNPEVRRQLRQQISRLGVSKALEKAGVSPGDKVRCGGVEWEW
ncbi:MAG: GTPase ObgE [Dehalococcoidales bacterium]|nr:GTPase ObgE [Dehalococcoidales bacterium]